MKRLLILGSLAANIALVGVLAYRPSLAPSVMRRWFAASSASGVATEAKKPAAVAPASKVWAQLGTSDLHLLVERLKAAGFPPDVIRSVVSTLVGQKFEGRMRALLLPDPNTPYWKLRPQFMGTGDKRYVEYTELERERSKEVRDLTQDLGESDDAIAAQRRRFGNLPAAKIAMVQRIESDYADMTANARAAMKGIVLQEDRDTLAYLQKQKQADLAAVLTPDELAEYDMRTSPLTPMLRSRLNAFDPSEAEYRSIFQAYQSISQHLARAIGPEIPLDMQARINVEQKLATVLQASLGADRYNQLLDTTSPDYQQVARIAQQENLPSDTANRIIALRNATSEQSAQIAQDATLSYEDKLTALKTLSANARLQIVALVPGTAGQSYAQHAGWLTLLDHGTAVAIVRQPPLVGATAMGGTYSVGMPNYRPIPIRGPRGH